MPKPRGTWIARARTIRSTIGGAIRIQAMSARPNGHHSGKRAKSMTAGHAGSSLHAIRSLLAGVMPPRTESGWVTILSNGTGEWLGIAIVGPLRAAHRRTTAGRG